MTKKDKFVEILQDNNDILEEFFDQPKGLFKKKKYTKQQATDAFNNIQNAINEYIEYDPKSKRYIIDDIKFGFTYDPENHDTNIIYDTTEEFNEKFQLISFELDRIFPETLEGNWLVTTYKIVVSDDSIILYNHNENFKYELLQNIFSKPINLMSLEEVTILQYILSWIVITIEFCDYEETNRDNFVEVLINHKYDDVNFYNQYDYEKALKQII